jgi:hypothetical protein
MRRGCVPFRFLAGRQRERHGPRPLARRKNRPHLRCTRRSSGSKEEGIVARASFLLSLYAAGGQATYQVTTEEQDDENGRERREQATRSNLVVLVEVLAV